MSEKENAELTEEEIDRISEVVNEAWRRASAAVAGGWWAEYQQETERIRNEINHGAAEF